MYSYLLTLTSVDPKTWQFLQQRFNRSDLCGVVRDVYDGAEYRKHYGHNMPMYRWCGNI